MLAEWVKEKKEKLGTRASGEKAWFKSNWLLILVALIGILLLLWPTSPPVESGSGEGRVQEEPTANSFSRNSLEGEVESILSQVEGAGRVKVSLALASDGVRSYAINEKEESRDIQEGEKVGGFRKTNDTNHSQDVAVYGSQTPLMIENKSPQVTGVLVVADGADNPVVREQLTDAVVTLMNVPPHKVRVLPRQGT